jgi:hypothetical protein
MNQDLNQMLPPDNISTIERKRDNKKNEKEEDGETKEIQELILINDGYLSMT